MSVTPATLSMHRPTLEALGDAQDNSQRFALGPLEPGFGYTIGSSLRRTLLSSIPGAAITQAVFDEALHEFTTIDGVVEDVTDVVLSLKDVVLRSHTDEPTAVRIDFEGPGELLAGDVEWGADVECLTPELRLVTLADKGRLALDVTVERGWGYLASEETRADNGDDQLIGAIALDAIFSPVRRVSVDVEPMRVGQATNYDRLVIEIETDGALTPAEALASAGETLGTLYGIVSDVSPDATGLSMPEPEVDRVHAAELELPLEELDLTERARNSLKRANLHKIGDIVDRSADELRAIPNFGEKSFEEVITRLDERGLTIAGVAAPDKVATPDKDELIGEPLKDDGASGAARTDEELIGAPEDEGA